MKKRLAPLVLGCLVAVLAAGPASAAGGNPIINDCFTHGALTRSYPVPALRHALAVMPASVKQYTSCYDVIQAALLRGGKPGGLNGGGGSGSFLPTPVLIVLIVLLLALVTALALGYRRRQAAAGAPADRASGAPADRASGAPADRASGAPADRSSGASADRSSGAPGGGDSGV